MAKLRWKGFNKKERSEEMRAVAIKGWVKRRKNKGKSERTLDTPTIPTPNA